MTISLKKVTAGSGYDYLIRQVAAQDSTVRTGLAAYYEEKGEAPGVWMGSGLDGMDGIAAGDPVTEAEMKALFGNGHHPHLSRAEGPAERPRHPGAAAQRLAYRRRLRDGAPDHRRGGQRPFRTLGRGQARRHPRLRDPAARLRRLPHPQGIDSHASTTTPQ